MNLYKKLYYGLVLATMQSIYAAIPNSIIDTITDASLNRPQAIAITPDNTTAYVCNYSGNTVSIIEIATNTVTGTISVSTSPSAIAITPNGSTAYVCNTGANTVSIIDIDTNTVTGTISVSTSPSAIAITPDGAAAYVLNASNTMQVINTAPLTYAYNTVVSVLFSSYISGPQAIALTPNGQSGYICSSDNNSVNVLYITSPTNIQAPTNISLTTGLLESSTASNYMNKISWTPPTNGPIVTVYKIYRDAELTQLAATISATNVPVFIEYNLTANTLYNYYIVSVDHDGNLSAPLHGSITTLA